MTDYETIRKDIYESFHDTFHKLYISELKDQIADKDEVITSNDHVIAEQQAEIERLRADLAHADAKGQENDKLLWGTIKANERLRAALRDVLSYVPHGDIRAEVLEDAAAEIERLRKMLWEVNEQCPEHVPVSLLNQIRAALKGK